MLDQQGQKSIFVLAGGQFLPRGVGKIVPVLSENDERIQQLPNQRSGPATWFDVDRCSANARTYHRFEGRRNLARHGKIHKGWKLGERQCNVGGVPEVGL